MRISSKRGDPGYHPDANLMDIVIKLNGEVIRNCVTADDVAGLVVTIGQPNGSMDLGRDWEAQEVETHGTVEIIGGHVFGPG